MTDALDRAITALKSGDKATARQLLKTALQNDRRNERAWLYMAQAVEGVEDKKKCLRNALKLNPENEQAQRNLAEVEEGSPKKKSNNLIITVLASLLLFSLVCLCFAYYMAPSPSSNEERPSTRREAPGDYVDILDGWGCENDSIGNTIFTGRIRNTHASRTLASVRLRGRIVRGDGVDVNTDWTYIDSDIVSPGATSSFTLYVDNPDRVSRCVISVESARFSN